MQIFILDRDPEISAKSLSDVHVIKMCLENVQILSTILEIKSIPRHFYLPKPYNTKHPVITAVDTAAKINWLLEYNFALQCEFYHRFGKRHAYFCHHHIYSDALYTYGVAADCSGMARVFTGFTTDEPDLVEAHRCYYRFKKTKIKRWKYTNSEEPQWITTNS